MRSAIVYACLSVLCGCTALTSDSLLSIKGENRAASGVYYALPKGLVSLTLLGDEAGRFRLEFPEPEYVADPDHRYLLRYQPHPSYDDDIDIEMNAQGRPFLKKIVSKTTDRTKDIIVDLAKAAAFTFQAAADDERMLAQVSLDPSDPNSVKSARDELHGAMRRFASERHRQCVRFPPAKPDANASAAVKDDAAAAKAVCGHFRGLLANDEAYRLGKKDGEALFTLSVADPPRPRMGRPADCSVGICYRSKIPYVIAYSVAGVTDTKVVQLPNGTQPIAIDISRAFLVKRFQEFDFDDDGFLTRVKIDKDSELLAAAKLPLEVINAVADGLQLRINLTQANTSNANAEAAAIKKRAELRRKQQDNRRAVETAAAKDASGRLRAACIQ